MGDRRRRRDAFFAQHPRCCFCSGLNAATTEDHQPGRVFFRGRVWPEGFVFPACEQCNQVSAESEKLMAVLIHGDGSEDDRGQFRKLLSSVRRSYPNLIDGMLPSSANEIRAILRKKGIGKPEGMAFSDVPVIKLDPAFWRGHFETFTRKLLLAFHYRTFSTPLSPTGAIWAFQHTNVDYAAGHFPDELIGYADQLVRPARQKVLLDRQFSLRRTAVAEHKTGLYVAQFHDRLAVSGVTTESVPLFSEGVKPSLMKPFQWN